MPAPILITLFVCVISSSPGMFSVIIIFFSMYVFKVHAMCISATLSLSVNEAGSDIFQGVFGSVPVTCGSSVYLFHAWLVDCRGFPSGAHAMVSDLHCLAQTNNSRESKQSKELKRVFGQYKIIMSCY